MKPPSSLEELIEALRCLPGVGPKAAQRMAFHLLQRDKPGAHRLTNALARALQSIRRCARCNSFAEEELCALCASPRRDASLLCVVERPSDVAAFERLGSFRGVYHVLGGVLSPLDGVGPDQLNLARLLERCAGAAEVILALGTHAEGEATATYIAQRLRGKPARVTRLARGLPAGSDLEYVDEITMQRAFEGRVNL